MTNGEFNKVLSRLARRQGRKIELPKDLSVFFPHDDGRQDLMYEQDFGLKPFEPLYAEARDIVLRADIPPAERVLLAGYLDLFLGEYQRAAETLGAHRSSSPSGYWPHFLHACALWLHADKLRSREQLPEALEAVEKAIAEDPAQRDAYVVRAGLRRELEDVPGRLADAERVIAMDPKFVWARTEKAEVLGETGHYRLALKEVNALLRRFPAQAWAWAQRGRLRGITGYYKLALDDFEKAAALDGRCGPLLAWRGETKRRLGRYPEALEDLDLAISLDPGYRLAHAWRGRIRLLLGEARKAVEDFDEALHLEPREMLAQAWRGEAWWKLKDYSRAAQDFDAVYPAEPEGLWNARLKTGQTQENYFMLDSSGGARSKAFWSDLYQASRGGDPWALAFFGRCLVAAGRVEEGLRWLTRALQKDPALAYAYAWRGEGARRMGASARARADLETATRLNPSHLWSWAWLGKTLADRAEHESALAAYEKALSSLEQRYALVHVWRGESLWALGRFDEATSSFSRAFVLDGKCKPALSWMKRLNRRHGPPAREARALAALGSAR